MCTYYDGIFGKNQNFRIALNRSEMGFRHRTQYVGASRMPGESKKFGFGQKYSFPNFLYICMCKNVDFWWFLLILGQNSCTYWCIWIYNTKLFKNFETMFFQLSRPRSITYILGSEPKTHFRPHQVKVKKIFSPKSQNQQIFSFFSVPLMNSLRKLQKIRKSADFEVVNFHVP